MTTTRFAQLIVASLAIAFVALPARGGQATNPLKQLSLEALGNIEVTTVSKEPETIRRTPAAVFVITQEDIKRSGATSIPEVLRLAPGVDVARIDSDHWSIGVRGFGDQFSKSLLVLIDGRSVYTPLFAGVLWSIQDTLLDDVERIEVIRGPGGTVWGANAVDGVINIITKSAKDTPGALASVGGGNVDHAIAGVRYGGGNGKDIDFRIYGRGFDRGPEFHADGQQFDDWRMGQAGFRVDWRERRDTVTLQGDLYNGRDGQSVSLASFSPPSQTVVYNPLNVAGGNLLATWRRALNGKDDIQVHTYFDRTSLLGPQVGETRNTWDVDFMHHVTAGTRQDLRWGLGARVSPSDIVQTVPTLDVTPHHETLNTYSVFAQDEVAIVRERLWLTIGAKFEHNSYTDWETQPSTRLLWAVTHNQSIWAAASRAVRTPSQLEEGFQLSGFLAPTPPTFLRITGNPNFASERLAGYEAGYRAALTEQFYIDVSAFINHHDNLESFGAPSVTIETSPSPAHLLLTFPYANGVTGTSRGIEIAPDWKPTRWWQLKGSYSYDHINLENMPGNPDTSAVYTYEGSTPRHQASIQSQLSLPSTWQVDSVIRYVSALPVRQIDAYATVDVRIGREIGDHLTVSVVGQNLADAHHEEFAHDPGPPVALRRSVYAVMTWRR